MATKKSNAKATNHIEGCSFIAEAGTQLNENAVNALTALAKASEAHAIALGKMADALKGSAPGVMTTGITIEGSN